MIGDRHIIELFKKLFIYPSFEKRLIAYIEGCWLWLLGKSRQPLMKDPSLRISMVSGLHSPYEGLFLAFSENLGLHSLYEGPSQRFPVISGLHSPYEGLFLAFLENLGLHPPYEGPSQRFLMIFGT